MQSQRASSTFCWLPPDSSRIFCSGPEHLMPRRSMKRSTISRCLASSTMPRAGKLRQQRQRQVLAHRHVGDDALDLAVLGAEADARARWRRPARGTRPRLPSKLIVPPSARSAPKTARAVSVRPEPSSPASPTISPARTSRLDVAAPGGRPARCSAREQLAPIACAWPWKPSRPRRRTVGRSRPSMAATSCELGHLGHRRDGDGAAVAHDGDPVADGVELVELVADEDHRDARRLELADDVEQDVDLVLVERARSARP